MWEALLGRLPKGLIMFCAFLSFALPYLIYKTNQFLHKYGDPPWKKTENQE